MKANKGWFKFHTHECPQCGRSNTWKEYIKFKDQKKPKDASKRYTYSQVWDGCGI